MAILTTAKTWRRAARVHKVPDLSEEESADIKRALVFLRVRCSGAKLAKALRVNVTTVTRTLSAKGKPSAAIALRAARLAGQPLDRVLDGSWPPEGACAHCGRL